LFELGGSAEGNEEWDASEEAEVGVDETPVDGDSTDWAGYEREEWDSSAGYEAELDDPLVADRITQRANERDGEDEVGEG
jgi:hypothetical protein